MNSLTELLEQGIARFNDEISRCDPYMESLRAFERQDNQNHNELNRYLNLFSECIKEKQETENKFKDIELLLSQSGVMPKSRRADPAPAYSVIAPSTPCDDSGIKTLKDAENYLRNYLSPPLSRR